MLTIKEELKQARPFASKAHEATVSLLRTADLIRRNGLTVLEPFDVTFQQFNVLRILRGAGDKGLPTLEIVERMVEDAPGITRLIDRLEERKLVSRERCPTDRRQVFCRIRPEGLALLAEIDGPLVESEARAMGSLGKKELTDLVALLDRAREALHRSIDHNRALNEERTRRQAGKPGRSK